MQQTSVAIAAEPLPIELRAQDKPPRIGPGMLLSMGLSIALLVAVAMELRTMDIRQLLALVPASPAFWIVFAAYYLSGPVGDWLIFRRLWRIPVGGFVALVRKLIYNELLLGYLGEAAFYAWARRKVEMTAAPFGAIKDVAIISALAGNGVTLGLLALVWPFLDTNALGIESRPLILSLGVVLAISMVVMVLRSRIFSLGRRELFFILRMHLLRIFVGTTLLALLWHLVLPAIPVVAWLVLGAFRLLISRLPLIPNKDVVFAGIAVLIMGNEHDVSALLTMMAGIVLATHVALGAALAAAQLARAGSQT